MQITEVTGIGPELAKKYAVLGVHTVDDLVQYFPRRYEDYSVITSIKALRPGPVSIAATIKQATGRYVRRGMHITEAIASDDTDSVRLLWFNQPYRAAALKPSQQYFISGTYELSHQRFAIMNPSVELASDFPVNTARIVPVYRETKGLTSNQIRRALRAVTPYMQQLPDNLPPWLAAEKKLLPYAQALQAMHFPPDAASLAAARERLGFQEVFELSLAALLNKYELLQDTALAIPFHEQLAKEFVAHLPFTLTDAQRKVVWQIYQDMQKTQPMNRLVEGDVGSGKTVVAAMAAVMAMHEGYQVALMAPTELLARQHAETLYTLLQPLQLADKLALLVGGLKPKEKLAAQAHIAAGHAQFIVGTHALIQEKVDMRKLGLVIIDEQHRFGVEQRKKLMQKAGHMPHLLSLTATPIPRSLALTLYGELDISVLDAKPAGRQPIITKICSPNSRAQLNTKIETELQAGRQMFVVCPLITDSEVSKANSAEKIYEQFRTRDFKRWRVGLLHGKMKPAEKNEIMQQFVAHQLDILVSTTVIEVGVDVPNASIMLIEAAEFFGLAQIHQLRGRVGRGGHKGYCYLMLSDSKAPPKRLEALQRSSDGFKLAELDLEMRGPGAIYGHSQHGELDLRVAKLTDVKLISSARAAAQAVIDRGEDLLQYNELYARVQTLRTVTNLN
ncbi:MAG TPA: ATP-dependent DNA helicase RecG [Candidatus Saccharimonadales bacterium]|nr:ATP-dependent DNA helicase RecG [Candidatus Saccharimonadales bacterium]